MPTSRNRRAGSCPAALRHRPRGGQRPMSPERAATRRSGSAARRRARPVGWLLPPRLRNHRGGRPSSLGTALRSLRRLAHRLRPFDEIAANSAPNFSSSSSSSTRCRSGDRRPLVLCPHRAHQLHRLRLAVNYATVSMWLPLLSAMLALAPSGRTPGRRAKRDTMSR